jgi:hypothetical protein
MRRALSAVFLGWMILGTYEAAFATVYVPGQYRSDGVYIRPHFKASTDAVPAIAQFPPLNGEEDTSKAEMKLPVIRILPPAHKEPPADPR